MISNQLQFDPTSPISMTSANFKNFTRYKQQPVKLDSEHNIKIQKYHHILSQGHQQHHMSASKKAETKAEKAEIYLFIVFCFHSVLHIQGHKLVWHPPCSWKWNERIHCMQYFDCQEIPSSAPFPIIEGFILTLYKPLHS